MQRLVRNIPTLAAIIVGSASFVLSFVALQEVSASVDAVPDHLAWLVPIVVDGGVLAGSASLWASSYQHTRRDPVAYLTVAALLAFSVVINVHHAGDTLIAKAIAALPPLVLLACLELVAAGHRRSLPRHTDPATAAGITATAAGAPLTTLYAAGAPHAVTRPVHLDPGLTHRETTSTADARGEDHSGANKRTAGNHPVSKAEQVRALYDDYILAGHDPRDPRLPTLIADTVGVAPSYVRRLIKPTRGSRVRAEAPGPSPTATT